MDCEPPRRAPFWGFKISPLTNVLFKRNQAQSFPRDFNKLFLRRKFWINLNLTQIEETEEFFNVQTKDQKNTILLDPTLGKLREHHNIDFIIGKWITL
jgi:hypothetical protein